MEIKNRLFPYPVLSSDTDDYENSEFNVSVDVIQGINEITLSFDINLENGEIQKLVNKGDAFFGVHIECSKTAYRKLIRTNQKNIVFHVSNSMISGDVALLGLVLAKTNLPYYKNSFLNADYKDTDILIPKAGIIAYCNMPKVRVTKNYEELKTSDSLFSIVKRYKENDDIRPIEFELGKDKIRILVDDNIYSAYIRYSMDDNAKDLIWSLLLLPAIIYMLEQLRAEGVEIYEETEWYQKISNSYKVQGLDFEEIIDNDEVSITDIAQEMLRLPIGKSFDSMKRISGGE